MSVPGATPERQASTTIACGTARIEGRSLQLERTQLRGGYVSFRFTDGQTVHRFQGQVGNGRISGQHASGERNARWRALKVEAVKP